MCTARNCFHIYDIIHDITLTHKWCAGIAIEWCMQSWGARRLRHRGVGGFVSDLFKSTGYWPAYSCMNVCTFSTRAQRCPHACMHKPTTGRPSPFMQISLTVKSYPSYTGWRFILRRMTDRSYNKNWTFLKSTCRPDDFIASRSAAFRRCEHL